MSAVVQKRFARILRLFLFFGVDFYCLCVWRYTLYALKHSCHVCSNDFDVLDLETKKENEFVYLWTDGI